MGMAKAVFEEVTDVAPFEVVTQTEIPQPAIQQVVPAMMSAPIVDTASLEAQGLEGLVIDWTSFPAIVLKDGGFEESSSGRSYGKEFKFHLIQTSNEFVYKAIGTNLDTKKYTFYSKTKPEAAANDVILTSKLNEWEAEGFKFECKVYLKALVQMIAPDEDYDMDLRILSIPHTSAGRFTPVIMKASALAGHFKNATFVASVGEKIRTTQFPYFPWAFSVSR